MAILFLVLLLFTCGLGVTRLLDPVEPSRQFQWVMRMLLLALGGFVGLFAWIAWEMR